MLEEGTPYLATVILKLVKQEKIRMEEYEYLQNLNENELIQIINEMLDFEEVTKALMILVEQNMEKTIELGYAIIAENKGDD